MATAASASAIQTKTIVEKEKKVTPGKKAAPAKHLIYFGGVAGRGEPIRFILRLAKVDFKDEVFGLEQFGDPGSDYHTRKKAGEFGTFAASGGGLPIYLENGKKYFETNAIMRMLGARYGFYSTDPDTMYEIDICLEAVEQFFNHAGVSQVTLVCFANLGKASGGDGPTKQQSDDCFAMYEKNCNWGQAQLAKHGKNFLAGTDKPTIADFRYIVQFCDSIYNEKSPVGADMQKRVKELIDTKCPDLKKWMEESMTTALKDVRTPGMLW